MTPPQLAGKRAFWSSLVLVGGCALATAQTTTTYAVSVPASGTGVEHGEHVAMTPDARFIAFSSTATNLVAGDTNNVADVFVRDRMTGTTERVSVHAAGVQSLGASYSPQITPDGRYVAFASIAPLVLADTNNRKDVYVRDLLLGTTTRVSVSSAGVQGDGDSGEDFTRSLDISDDGNLVVFQSLATNLVASDTNLERDIFLRDISAGITTLVGIHPSGPQASNNTPVISGDGHWLAWRSVQTATPGGNFGIYVRDLLGGTTALASADPQGGSADRECWSPCISNDGRYVAFTTDATDLVQGETNLGTDVYVRDMQATTCELASLDNAGVQGTGTEHDCSMSEDARFIVFLSNSLHWLPGDVGGRKAYLRDRMLGTLRCASIAPTGVQIAFGYQEPLAVSADGTSVCFVSSLSQHFPPASGDHHVYLRVDTIPLPYTLFCPGTATTCPCNPPLDAWAGCRASGTGSNLLGATITAIGNPSVGNDTIQLVATGFGNNTPMLFFQGTAQIGGGNGAPFGDGKRCIGGTVVRLAIKTANISISMGHHIGTDLPISVKGNIPAGGGTRHYQAWYRDPPVYCTPSTFNLSNGMTIVWQP